MRKNIGLNAILNVIRSCMSVIFPLVTYPYALRVLGSESIGKVQYGSSIVSYFSLIAMLGVATYGVREGAKLKDDQKRLAVFVNELFTINLLSTIFAYLLLALTILIIPKLQSYSLLICIQSLSILFTTLGVDWINTIFENYILITIRSIAIHIVSAVLLFVFVKSPADYYIYAFLVVLGNIITCILNWFYIRKYVNLSLTRNPRIKVHMKPLLLIFANYIAISVYVNFDMTMLGWMKGDSEVGLYSASVKIYTIVKGILSAVYAVFVPRLASCYGIGDRLQYKNTYSDLWCYLSLLVIPASVGLICVAPELMMFIGGQEYISSVTSLQILSVALIFAIYGGLLTAVLNITLGREKMSLIATLISTGINAGLNLIAIPMYGQYGAAVTTGLSEAFVFAFCLKNTKEIGEYINVQKVRLCVIHAGIGSLMIIAVAIFVNVLLDNWVIKLIVTLSLGIIAYGATLVIARNYIVQDIIQKIRGRLKRNEMNE